MNIQLLFPTDTPEIDVGVTLTFEDISGYLPTSRLEGDIPITQIEDIDGFMTANEAHSIWENA